MSEFVMQQSTGAVRPVPIRSRTARLSVHTLASHLPVILFIVSVALFIGALAAASVPQRFQASTTLVLTNAQGYAPLGDTPDTAAAIMATSDFAREVIARLNISSDALLAPRILPPVATEWLVKRGLMSPLPERQSEVDLIRAYLEALETKPISDGRALVVTISANQPEMAVCAANVIAQVYLGRRQAAEMERNLALDTAEQKVLQAQAALQEALEQERAFRTNPAGTETARQARKVTDDLALLVAERAALALERDALLRQSNRDDHLNKRIDELETAIRLRQAVIATATDNSDRQQALERAVKSARVELSLERERLSDEMMRLQSGVSPAYVAVPAQLPTQTDRTLPSIIGGITALIIAACLFWIMTRALHEDNEVPAWNEADTAHQHVMNPADNLDVKAIQAVSASIPPAVQTEDPITAPPTVDAPTPFSVVRLGMEETEAFETLSRRLAIQPQKDGGAYLLVFGADERIDVLPLARNLARHLAMRERVILLDLSLIESDGDMQTPGLTDLIAGQASFAEIITRDLGSRLHQISRGSSKVNGDQMRDAIELAMVALDQTYDRIVQTIPIKEQDMLLQHALKRADAVVLVAQGMTVDTKIFAAYESLREKGLENIVVALIG